MIQVAQPMKFAIAGASRYRRRTNKWKL